MQWKTQIGDLMVDTLVSQSLDPLHCNDSLIVNPLLGIKMLNACLISKEASLHLTGL